MGIEDLNFRGSDEEIKEEALGYIAYSGPFRTDEEKQTLTHWPSSCIRPRRSSCTPAVPSSRPATGLASYVVRPVDGPHPSIPRGEKPQ
jgi:hypothetical protein